MRERELFDCSTPLLLMVSGGSDSTALAYLAAELRAADDIGHVAMLHVNHQLRGDDADADEAFVAELSRVLDIPLSRARVDVARVAQEEGANIEAVARRVRYEAAHEELALLCCQAAIPVAQGRILVAHTADDRVENFYMRSIVGTGPGGFRSMRYLNGQVARPLLDCSRQDLRCYIAQRAEKGLRVVRDAHQQLWREDATNAHTDRFRSYVRHEIVPRSMERNPHLLATLTRSMNLIGDEDDMLEALADDLQQRLVQWLVPAEQGCVLSPLLAHEHIAMQRRVAFKVLERLLGSDARIETATIDAVLAAYDAGHPRSGYVANVQGNLAISANKKGVRIEPMASFRMRRKR